MKTINQTGNGKRSAGKTLQPDWRTQFESARQAIELWSNHNAITVDFKFVPFSLSRNAGNKNPSLNYKVTLHHNGREFLRFDYSQGYANCPSYKPNIRYQWESDAIRHECETNRKTLKNIGIGPKIPPPKLSDVLSCISKDADALNYGGFEDWATSCGYDADSRSAEVIYKTCLECGLKLRNAVGENELQKLADLASRV
jgi:hypothetical protein